MGHFLFEQLRQSGPASNHQVRKARVEKYWQAQQKLKANEAAETIERVRDRRLNTGHKVRAGNKAATMQIKPIIEPHHQGRDVDAVSSSSGASAGCPDTGVTCHFAENNEVKAIQIIPNRGKSNECKCFSAH